MTKKHTSEPWFIHNGTNISSDNGYVAEAAINNVIGFEEAAANAEFIVRACNSHYDLLEALQVILNCSSVDMDTGEITLKRYDALHRAHAAVAKAKGESIRGQSV